MVDFMNPVWETLILPPVPGTVRGAWASYYAHHNIGGILRGVTLVLQSAAGTVRLRFFSEKYAGGKRRCVCCGRMQKGSPLCCMRNTARRTACICAMQAGR